MYFANLEKHLPWDNFFARCSPPELKIAKYFHKENSSPNVRSPTSYLELVLHVLNPLLLTGVFLA